MKTSRTPCKTGLLTAVCVVAGSICMSASNEKGLISARPSERSETLPLEMQFAVSAALGKDQTEYHVSPMTPADQRGEREGYQAANPDQHFNVRFNAQGACIAINGTRWRLSVREWGYGDPGYAEGFADSPSRSAMAERGASAGSAGFYAGGGSAYGRESPTAAAPLVYANRVEYRRGALT